MEKNAEDTCNALTLSNSRISLTKLTRQVLVLHDNDTPSPKWVKTLWELWREDHDVLYCFYTNWIQGHHCFTCALITRLRNRRFLDRVPITCSCISTSYVFQRALILFLPLSIQCIVRVFFACHTDSDTGYQFIKELSSEGPVILVVVFKNENKSMSKTKEQSDKSDKSSK